VFGHFRHGNSWCSACGRCATSRNGTAATAQTANDGIRSVLADDVRGVDHVELLRSILSGEGQDSQFSPRVVAQETGHIQNLAINHHPAICLAVVLGHICHADATAATTAVGDGRRCRNRRRIHLVLVAAAGQFGGLHGTGQATTSELPQVHVLQVCPQHVLRRSLARHSAEDHTVQQRIATQAVVAVHAACHLASSIEPGDGFVVGPNAGAVRVNQQATHAVVDHWCDDGHVERLVLHA